MSASSPPLGPERALPPYGALETPPMSGSARQDFAVFLENTQETPPGDTLRAWLDLAEAWRIRQALAESGGNRTAAARLLGIGRRTLYAKMAKLEILGR